MANYRHGATYGSLAYDLDALAREKQLDEESSPRRRYGRRSRRYSRYSGGRARHGPRCGPPLFCCWERCWWWAWSSR